MSQALLQCFEKHCSGTVSAGPRNNIYHLACHICRNYLLCITEILCLAGVGRFFAGEGD